MPGPHAPFSGSRSDLSPARLRGPAYRRETRDVYVLAEHPPSQELRWDAVLLALPDAVLSHRTAGRVLRLPLPPTPPGAPDEEVHVTRPPGSGRSVRPGLRTSRASLGLDDVVLRRGRPVTSPARTFLDLAPLLDLPDAVALGDAVAARVGPAALRQAVHAAAGRRGARRAREALALVDPRAESAPASHTRLLLHAAGYTAVRHGVRVLDEAGQWLCAPDLADPVARVAVQYDGLVHLLDPEQRRNDIDRDELARAAGWEVVVLTARDLREPAAAVAKVAAAYARSSARAGAGPTGSTPGTGPAGTTPASMARRGAGSRSP